MARRAKQPEPKATFMDYAGHAIDAIGARAAENPVATGGSVAFAVVMFFVSSNALFYQPYQHKDAFFHTRSMDNYVAPVLPKVSVNTKDKNAKSETFKIARDESASPAVQKDMVLVDIQSALASMKLYDGSIDGLPGPKTREAITTFQQQAGLEPTGEIDPLLVDAIRTASIPAAKIPTPRPRQETTQRQESTEPLPEVASAETSVEMSQDDIKKIQAGLKSFGNDSIEIDGKIGGKTKQALEEFQGLFKLPVTGQADRETLSKLQEIGLVSG
ncbi:MAG: peptidoglycan-binding domain-containing protein [Rhizobiaceae bacterium]